MSIRLLPNRLKVSDFTPLDEHQSQTPVQFFGGRPVLHNHTLNCDVVVLGGPDGSYGSETLRKWLHTGLGEVSERRESTGDAPRSEREDKDVVRQGVETAVTSENLVLSHPLNTSESIPESSGSLSIPYEAITLHAVQRVWKIPFPEASSAVHQYSTTDKPNATQTTAIYLQLDPSYSTSHQRNPNYDDSGHPDDDEDYSPAIQALIVPSPSSEPEPQTNGTSNSSDPPNHSATQAIFAALSSCAELHPGDDEQLDEEEEDDAMAPVIGGGMPGEGGWITAENAHEFEGFAVDVEVTEDGRILGPGAGTRRSRVDGADADEDALDGVNGHAEDGDEESTKWQRTG